MRNILWTVTEKSQPKSFTKKSTQLKTIHSGQSSCPQARMGNRGRQGRSHFSRYIMIPSHMASLACPLTMFNNHIPLYRSLSGSTRCSPTTKQPEHHCLTPCGLHCICLTVLCTLKTFIFSLPLTFCMYFPLWKRTSPGTVFVVKWRPSEMGLYSK